MPPIAHPWLKADAGKDEARVDSKEFARRLRKQSTDSERKLRKALRNRGFRGNKFRRQHPVEPYVLDFYCEHHKLAIELDGGSHVTEEGRAYDQQRTECLARQGIRVFRISNYEMLVHTDNLLNWLWHQMENLESER